MEVRVLLAAPSLFACNVKKISPFRALRVSFLSYRTSTCPSRWPRVTDEDWAVALQVFRAVRSGRGDKGRDDRRFREAMHYFTLNNISWPALPAAFGPWNSVWKRFWRLREAGVFEVFFDTLADLSGSAHLVQMFDSTVVRAQFWPQVQREGKTGRRSAGRAVASRPRSASKPTSMASLSPSTDRREGRRQSRFPLLLDLGPDVLPRAALADKGYDSMVNRAAARTRGICPAIPTKAKAKNGPSSSPRSCTRVERGLNRPSASSSASSASTSAVRKQLRVSPVSSH